MKKPFCVRCHIDFSIIKKFLKNFYFFPLNIKQAIKPVQYRELCTHKEHLNRNWSIYFVGHLKKKQLTSKL